MYLKLARKNWEVNEFKINKRQKDYNFFDKANVSVFIYGYPFNDIKKCWVSANDVWNLYLKDELNFIHNIEGVYGIIILDRKRRKCFVIIDRYGVYSLFYFKDSNYFIISDTISEIVAFMPNVKLNKDSIIEYLFLGYCIKLGNKTHIEQIYEFEGAVIYKIDETLNMKQEIYWNFLCNSRKRLNMENFRKLFNLYISTALNLENKISLALTGGLDTRTILSASFYKKEKLHCCTYGISKKTKDVKLARKISKYFGIDHSFYELDEFFIKNLPKNLEENADIYNGLIATLNYLHIKELCEKEEAKGELFIWGILGNELWGSILGHLVKMKSNLNIDELSLLIVKTSIPNRSVLKILKNYNEFGLTNLLRNLIKRGLSNVNNSANPVILLDFFALRNFCSNWASNLIKLSGKYFKVFIGYLNNKLLREIPFIPLEDKISRSIQKYIVTKNNSYLARLPLDSGMFIKSNLILKFITRIRSLIENIVWKVNEYSYKLFKKRIFNISPPLHDYFNWLRNYHKSFVINTLTYEKMVTKKLFEKQILKKIIKLYLNGESSLHLFISSLISLEIWLKNLLNYHSLKCVDS